MRKIKLLCLFLLNCYAVGLPTFDSTNLVQNTIQAVQSKLSYLKQINDWKDTLLYYKDNIKKAQQQIENASGIKEAISSFSKLSSDYSTIYGDFDSFRDEVLQNPQDFINNNLKDSFKKYEIFDNCKNKTGDYLNLCLQEKIQYAAAYDQLDKDGNNIETLSKSIQKLDEKIRESQDIKESADWANKLSIAQLQMQQLQLKVTQDSYRFQVWQKELEDRKQQLLSQNVNTTVDSSSWLK